MSGVATLYGRLATSFVASCGSSIRSASPKTRSTFAGELVQRGLERAVDLDRVDAADALGEVAREHALPGADLEHDVVRAELGEPPDHLRGCSRSTRKCWPYSFFTDRSMRSRCRSICRSSSAGSSPRACASAASVWTTFAGSFGLPAHGLRREVGRVGLGEDALGGNLGRREAEVDGLREGRVAGERDVPAALERGRQQVRRREAVEDDRSR